MHQLNGIRRHSNMGNCCYIKTTDNIEDYCTRPRNIKKLIFIRPRNLNQKELTKSSYMESSTRNQLADNLTLKRKVTYAKVKINQLTENIIHWDYYSSWNILVRHIPCII